MVGGRQQGVVIGSGYVMVLLNQGQMWRRRRRRRRPFITEVGERY
jgi:hypothetical protein